MPHNSLGYLVRVGSRSRNGQPEAGRATTLSAALPVDRRIQPILRLR